MVQCELHREQLRSCVFCRGSFNGFSSCLGEEMGEHRSIEGGERLIGMALVNLLVEGTFSSVYTIDG